MTQSESAAEARIAGEERLRAQLSLMSVLQDVSTRLVRDEESDSPLAAVLDAAIHLTGADMGTLQIVETGLATFRIAASRGFDGPGLALFVSMPEARAALSARGRVIIENVIASPLLGTTPALAKLLGLGVRALQSTALVSRSGSLLGLLSTHYRVPRTPDARNLPLLDTLARQTADWIERSRSQARLMETKDALEAANRRKDEFLAVLAHELRNPLASILAAARLLRRAPHAVQSRDSLDIIEKELGLLTHMMDDLLDVSRIAAGQIVLRCEPVDLRRAAHRAMESLRPLFESRSQRPCLELADESIVITGDEVRLVQVFSNLLSNAAKFTAHGGRLGITVGRTGARAIVKVRDEGRGISRGELQRIFDASGWFNSSGWLQHERDRAGGGLGIGLALSRRLVQLHAGTLEAFSEGPGCGSEFVVSLPLAEKPVASMAGDTRPTPFVREGDSSYRVLIVDDNESFATAMTGLLRAMGHDAHAIHDGTAATSTIRTLQPQVVLLDLQLPGALGYDIVREIRRDPLLDHTLLIAVSGFGQERDKQHSRLVGFDHHLTKPVDENQLERIIDQAMTHAGARP